MRRHALSLVALLALSCAVQACCVLRAVAPAQDAVRYVLAAKTIERNGLRTLFRDEPGHPLFPVLVWAMHGLLTPWLGTTADAWAASAQIAAAVPLLLAVLPVYGFLLSVVRWRAALAGTIFFCVIPAVARLGADGISDSTHLCLLCVALWAAAKYWRQWGRHASCAAPAWLLLVGAASALAALARKEALVLLPVMCGTFVLLQCRATWRQPWTRVARSGLCLGVGASSVFFPYLVTAGATQPRHAIARLLGQPRPVKAEATEKKAMGGQRSSRWRTADGKVMDFAKKDPQASLRFRGYTAAVTEFAHELAAAFHYVLAPLAILGLWSAWRRLPWPIALFLGLFVTAYALATMCVAGRWGYLAPRHLLPIVLVNFGWAGEGAWEVGRWLACAFRIPAPALRAPRLAIPSLAVGVVALCCLPRTLAPQHASRLGHRQAAAWLAEQASPGDVVLDTRGWSRLYTELRTYSYGEAKNALRDCRLAYIVLEESERQFDSRRGQTLRELLACGGECVGRFAPGADCKAVEIYRWHPDHFAARRRGQRLAN